MQHLHDLSWEIRRVCRLIEEDVRELHKITLLSKRSQTMQDDASLKIDRLRERVDSIDAKIDTLYAKIASVDASMQSIASNASFRQEGSRSLHAQSEGSGLEGVLNQITARERQVLGVLFNYGALSYREIAGYLAIAPITVKSLVNRMLEDPAKSKLLAKHRDGRELKIGLAPEVEQKILKKQKEKPLLEGA